MNLKYFCDECDTEIRKGEKFCHECGKKIDWPEEEEIEAVRIEPVAPAEKRSSTSSDMKAIRKFVDGVTAPAIGVLLFGVAGIIIGIAILVRCSKIRNISYKERLTSEDRETVRKKILNIRSEARFVSVLNIIVGLVTIYGILAAQATTGYESAAIIINAFLTATAFLVGIIFASNISSKANDALEKLGE